MNPAFDSLKKKPAEEEDLPPGATGTYYGGPLAGASPKPTPPPEPKKQVGY